MKTTFLLVSILCMTVAGCIGDPTIDTDEAEVLVSEPDAGEVTANVGGAENCPPDQAERPGGCTGEGGGGGTGGGPTGDQCTPGAPGCETCTPGQTGCPGPVRPRPPCVAPSPDHVCTYYPSGGCYCVYYPPPLTSTVDE
jgi:hypothetical protein